VGTRPEEGLTTGTTREQHLSGALIATFLFRTLGAWRPGSPWLQESAERADLGEDGVTHELERGE
jgi:hypothetical protein